MEADGRASENKEYVRNVRSEYVAEGKLVLLLGCCYDAGDKLRKGSTCCEDGDCDELFAQTCHPCYFASGIDEDLSSEDKTGKSGGYKQYVLDQLRFLDGFFSVLFSIISLIFL